MRNRIAETEKALECPLGYTGVDARADVDRLEGLGRKPQKALTAAEDAEQAHLMARIETYKATPAAHAAWDRVNYLVQKKFVETLTPAEASELAELKAHSPHPNFDISNHPNFLSYMACRKAS